MRILEGSRAALQDQLQQAVGEHAGQLILLRLEEWVEQLVEERVLALAARRGWVRQL